MAFWNRKSITASAALILPGDKRAISRAANAYRPWQSEAWNYYDLLPELHYPANFTGASMSRFTLHVGVLDPKNPGANPHFPTQAERTPMVKAAEVALAELGNHSEILRRYGLNDTIAADGYLYGEDTALDTEWEMLSISELHPDSTGNMSRWPTGLNEPEPLPDGGWTSIRIFRAHPRYTQLADGPLQPLIGDCERLLALNDSITSRLLSRLSQAGILFFPNSLKMAGDAEADEKPDGTTKNQDPFLRRMLNTMERAILSRGTAAGSIPILVRGQSGEGEHIVHITLDRNIDRVEFELRSELRATIAGGMDLPTEQQTGMAEANHWSSWSILDSTYRTHLVPKTNDFAKALTPTYLWRAIPLVMGRKLTDFSEAEKAELRRIVIMADGSDVIARPNEAEDGFNLAGHVAISPKALRHRAGASEDEAPTEEEYVQGIGRKFSDAYLAIYGMDIADKIDWSKVSTRQPGAPGQDGQSPTTPPSKRPASGKAPVGGPGTGDAGKSQRGKQNEADQMTAAAMFAFTAADSVVGAKLRALTARPEYAEQAALIKHVANSLVLTTLRDNGQLDSIDVTSADLGGFYLAALDDLRLQVAVWQDEITARRFITLLAAKRPETTYRPSESSINRIALDVLSLPTS